MWCKPVWHRTDSPAFKSRRRPEHPRKERPAGSSRRTVSGRLSGARIGGIRPVMRSLDASAAKSAYHPARLAERLRAVADPGQRGRRGCESSVRASDAAVRSLQDDCGPRGVSRRVEKDAKKLCISGRRSGRPTHRAGLRQLVTMWERGPGAGGGPSRAGERA